MTEVRKTRNAYNYAKLKHFQVGSDEAPLVNIIDVGGPAPQEPACSNAPLMIIS